MPKFCGVNYKGADEVAARRDIKIRVVNVICDAADRYPLTASRGNRLPQFDPNDEFRVDPVAENVILALQQIANEPGAQAIFTTAKGCTSKPADAAGQYQQQNFHAFCLAAGQAICAGSYIEAAWAWAVQIIGRNSHSFPAASRVHAIKRRVDAAELAWRARFV